MNRLYERGYIYDPIGKAKSVVLTEEGLKEAERLFKTLLERVGCSCGEPARRLTAIWSRSALTVAGRKDSGSSRFAPFEALQRPRHLDVDVSHRHANSLTNRSAGQCTGTFSGHVPERSPPGGTRTVREP